MTLGLAISTPAVVVLGITFSAEDRSAPRYETMEIILVQQQSDAPDEAKMLAQANLQGGGDADEDVVPATPLPAPFPDDKAEVTVPQPANTPATAPTSDPEKELLAVRDNQDEVPDAVNKPDVETANRQEAQEQKSVPEKEVPSATTLLTNSYKIAALNAEIKRKLEAKAARPKLKFISASTREYKYAAYMDAWRIKVERVGNLNYPEAARQQKLSGSLILDVALNPDGTINDIIIRRSSGHKILDDAAVRIVNLAGPYSPFPDDIKSETDILHITRTWQFLADGGFQ
jgi:protein TonB